jgi:outer membrane protein assembly factor BamD (BamD/ComL family)
MPTVPEASNRAAISSRDPLREESTLLERARAELRGGHPRSAQATLLRLEHQFPKGGLTQEREVLLIEALAARGNARAAARDAQSFIATHPESPHAVPLRRFIEHGETHSN